MYSRHSSVFYCTELPGFLIDGDQNSGGNGLFQVDLVLAGIRWFEAFQGCWSIDNEKLPQSACEAEQFESLSPGEEAHIVFSLLNEEFGEWF